VDNNSSFSSPEINQTTTSTSYTPGTALAADTYYWRVQASNDCGDGSWSSPVWDFTVQPDTTPSLVYDGPGVLSRGGSYMVDEEDQRITMGDHVHLRLPFRNAGSQPISNATVEVLGEQSADKNKYLGITVHDGSDGSTYQHQAIIHLTPSTIDPGKIGFADFWIYVSNPRSRSSLSGGGSLQLQYSGGESRVLVWAEEISFDTRGNETLKFDSCLHTPDNFAIQRYAQFAAGARWGEGNFGSNNDDPDTVEQAVRNLLWRVASDFVHDTDSNEPRVPDTTLLTRLGRPTGACRHFADLTAGLLRSLGLPARVTKAAFKKYLVVGVGHNWVEVYLEADSRWVQADSYWTTLATAVFDEPGTYEDEGWTVSKAWADKYPLSSAASQYAEEYLCTPTCYNTPVDCPICIRDSEVIRLPSLWPNLSCVEDVKSSYHNVGLAQAAIATDSDEQLWIQLLNPTFVTLLEPFDLTASIVNGTTVPLDAITATVATKAYVDSTAPLFEVSPPYQVVTNLNSGEAANVTWVVTPLITGSNIPLRLAAESGGFFEIAEQPLVVNEPGTLPDLTLGGMCGIDTALPGGAITLRAYVLDENLQPLTDTATFISATVYATPTLLFSTTVNLPWCEACSMYQGMVNLPDTAPIGSYQVDFVATRSGYEADEATGFFFVTPPLDVSLTTNHDRLDVQDTLTLTAQVSDRGTAITDASVWAEIDTPGGVITAPLVVENGNTYMLAFRPVDLAVEFNGSASPGTWLIRATADYQGSEVTVQKTVVVRGPLYLPIVLKNY